jgi:flavin reductase (DIM6/NTAB) family NADH-FMN oxidoreductase RutF
MPIDDGRFKLAMSHFASGVTIVTAAHEGKQYGMTVASFASLSLNPPLVLVCVAKDVKTHDAIAAAGAFGVSILGAGQADVSGRFASKSDDKFAGTAVRNGELGVPMIEGSLCAIECRLHASLPGGDHTIFVGEVVGVDAAGEGSPLVYYRSGYRALVE